jgi:hypothetical protein
MPIPLHSDSASRLDVITIKDSHDTDSVSVAPFRRACAADGTAGAVGAGGARVTLSAKYGKDSVRKAADKKAGPTIASRL